MNGKTAKLLRKLARAEGTTSRSIKRNYSRLNRIERGAVKEAIAGRVK